MKNKNYVCHNLKNIISVSSYGVLNTKNTQCDIITTALCDDGSVWMKRGYLPNGLVMVDAGSNIHDEVTYEN